MSKEIIEAEIIDNSKNKNNSSSYAYAAQNKNASAFAWSMGFSSILFAFIPIFGFIYAWIALLINIIKKTPPILPIISLIISGFITTSFVLFVWVLKIIF